MPTAPDDSSAGTLPPLPCPLCGARKRETPFTTVSRQGTQHVVQTCGECGAWYLDPPPTTAELAAAYDDAYYGEQETKFVGWIERQIDRFRAGRARRLARRLPPGGAVLDIGCGNGRFLGHLIALGCRGYGVELAGRAAERARAVPGLTLHVGPLAECGWPAASFDAVTLWHVFEHLPDPRAALADVFRLLKPGGWLFLSMPNNASWQARWFRGRWLHLDPPRHLFLCGPKTLAACLSAQGFAPRRVAHFSLEQNPFGFAQSVLNCVHARRDVLLEALKGNRAVAGEAPRWLLGLEKLFWLGGLPLWIALAGLEAACRRGGTLEIVAQKPATADADERFAAALPEPVPEGAA